MVSTMERRVRRLELERTPPSQMWVIEGPDGMQVSTACELIGVQPGPLDMVVYLRDFCSDDPPRLVHGPAGIRQMLDEVDGKARGLPSQYEGATR